MYATSYESVILTHIATRTVSKFLQIIGQIFAVDRGRLSLIHSFGSGWTPKFRIAKLGLNKLQTSFYNVIKTYFDILYRLGVTHKCDWETMDRHSYSKCCA